VVAVDVVDVGLGTVVVAAGRVVHGLVARVAVEQLGERGFDLRFHRGRVVACLGEQVAVLAGGDGARVAGGFGRSGGGLGRRGGRPGRALGAAGGHGQQQGQGGGQSQDG